MHSRAELYRRRGIQAQQHAAQANQPNIKDAFEQVARDWFALAEQVEWLEGHYRALGFGEPRDRKPKSTRSGPQQATETGRHAFEPTKMPANCGLFVRERETPVRMGLHGGPGRIRTSNQTVMSAPMWRHAYFDFTEFLDGTAVLTNEIANDWRRSFPAIASTALRMCAGW